ncbi:uncharacterized protein LOC128249830 [Octopus bimaculoides]|uniref:uncharacterized protein LOC128249830 n=1 Tax=Octopus bimaculoides TaxID=37653 RepID=UPI0022E604BE|nr:uncharacterized protein LOC128249830 [Octopus bimaculoides]
MRNLILLIFAFHIDELVNGKIPMCILNTTRCKHLKQKDVEGTEDICLKYDEFLKCVFLGVDYCHDYYRFFHSCARKILIEQERRLKERLRNGSSSQNKMLFTAAAVTAFVGTLLMHN